MVGSGRPQDALRKRRREGGGVVLLRNNKKITMIIVKLVLVPDVKVVPLDVEEVICDVQGVIQ